MLIRWSICVAVMVAGLVTYVTTGAAGATSTDQVIAEYYRQIGQLAPEYVANLACAKEQIGAQPFEDLKKFALTVGPDEPAKLQVMYDRVRSAIEALSPSERRRIAQQKECAKNATHLNHQINQLMEEAKIYTEITEGARH